MNRAGQLRQVVVLQSRSETQNSTGEVTWTWTEYQTVRASVEPIRGREYFEARQIQSAATTLIRIRYLSGITTKMRVKHGTRYYEIEGVIDVNSRHRELQLMCVEREADGWRD